MPWYDAQACVDVLAVQQRLRRARQTPPREPQTMWWVLVPKDIPSRVAGMCALAHIDPHHGRCHLDFELFHADRGKGLMHDALQALLHAAFVDSRLNRVEAEVNHLNLPAMRLLRSLGFQQEGCRREAAHDGQLHHDLLLFGLLAREFGAV